MQSEVTKSKKCCVPHCKSYRTKDISLHSFPSDLKLFAAWKIALKLGKVPESTRVCCLHFTENDFTITSYHRRRLKRNAVPSQLLEKPSDQDDDLDDDIVDHRMDQHWIQKCFLNVEKNSVLEDGSKQAENMMECDNEESNEEQSCSDNMSNEKITIQIQSNEPFELPQILNTDEKLLDFTGINFAVLRTIIKCSEEKAQVNECKFPSLEARIILVLVKLKTGLSFSCLAALFNLSHSSCMSTFKSTVSLMATSLKSAIYWPKKHEILKNMPKCFEKFRDTRVVIDCTEIKILSLKCGKCRKMSYSHYKEMHTIKYLIGFTPSGLISLVSAGYGGSATHKDIFYCEHILDKLDMHDAVMASREILNENECKENKIKLIIPPFLKKQKLFSKENGRLTADITSARVHVDKAIEKIRSFKILQEQFDKFLIPHADEIMTVIAAIVNLSPVKQTDDKMTA